MSWGKVVSESCKICLVRKVNFATFDLGSLGHAVQGWISLSSAEDLCDKRAKLLSHSSPLALQLLKKSKVITSEGIRASGNLTNFPKCGKNLGGRSSGTTCALMASLFEKCTFMHPL